MNQKRICCLVLLGVLAGGFPIALIAQAQEQVNPMRERADQAQLKKDEVVVRIRKGGKVLVGPKALPFEFSKSGDLGGRITETRDQVFTLTSGRPGKDEYATIISYEDVQSIKHLSGFEKAMKGTGKIFRGIGGGAVVLPIYGILALLGKVPEC